MKRSIPLRFLISLALLFALLSPVATLGFVDGRKYFKQGMKHEDAQEWDAAVEQFALAVSDSPRNPEYRLHLIRALFNASQMYMRKGTTAAKEKDFEAGYIAFRKAYAFDPTNELAKSEMERMVRLQKELNGDLPKDEKDANGKAKLVPAGFSSPNGTANGPLPQVPQRLEKLRDLPFSTGISLQFLIKELAKDLDLNVLFDVDSFRTERKTYIELKNVTAARALDYLFLQEGLFFQRVGPRTIIVATQVQRQKFQQLVLRTFYLGNAAPKDIAKVVQTAIPAQPGRSQTIVLTDDATNSITIRDTEENIRLIGKLIASLDKDRAEVVMDVAIYEISKNDLLRLGNQIGGSLLQIGASPLQNLGGSNQGVVPFGGGFGAGIATAIASGLIIPPSVISAFQSQGNTKLLASTQIHAFNNEDSSARIGQRVPVQTAQFLGVGTGGNPNPGGGFGQTANVINYEQVGLTLKFKPLVFPNQDVQVAMEIESKDVQLSSDPLTPTFTERTIKGTARIQNNKTLLLASVATGVERNGRQGLPLLGWLPIIGRLFSTPTKDNSQVDIVIAVTPRVIRAPAILPEDEIDRPTGSVGVPTTSSLEAMIIDEEREELLAAARRMPTAGTVQLPDRQAETPVYVKTDAAATTATTATGGQTDKTIAASAEPAAAAPLQTNNAAAASKPIETTSLNLKPIDTSVKTLQLNQTADTSGSVEPAEVKPPAPETVEKISAPAVEVKFGADLPEMKAGDKIKVPVMLQGSGAFRSAVMGIKFDDKKMAVRGVSLGDVFAAAGTNAPPFLNQNGKMYISFSPADGKDMKMAGTLAFIEIEALAAGKPEIAFDRDVLNFLTADGKNFAVKFQD